MKNVPTNCTQVGGGNKITLIPFCLGGIFSVQDSRHGFNVFHMIFRSSGSP